MGVKADLKVERDEEDLACKHTLDNGNLYSWAAMLRNLQVNFRESHNWSTKLWTSCNTS